MPRPERPLEICQQAVQDLIPPKYDHQSNRTLVLIQRCLLPNLEDLIFLTKGMNKWAKQKTNQVVADLTRHDGKSSEWLYLDLDQQLVFRGLGISTIDKVVDFLRGELRGYRGKFDQRGAWRRLLDSDPTQDVINQASQTIRSRVEAYQASPQTFVANRVKYSIEQINSLLVV